MSRRNRLIENELASLRRYARALCATPDEAIELTATTAAIAIASWEQRTGDATLRTWLFSLMRNEFRGEPRPPSRWASPDVAAPHTEEIAGRAAPRPTRRRLEELGAGLPGLSDEQRETLYLVAVEGFSYADVSSLVGAPVGVVTARLSRARERLRGRVGAA